ncbi:DUF1186 domain-containing protein [Legionella sp. km772]|uniref:DUF1186 domain-containing protein n=1 Tax=Legionella sp. km772 TaxID=2498111 RepID=UPI000F8D89D6|nr:DUF1186 domain-containing protein [Legionella sp. km772]RUR09506.1 DUF1186 domain-containing protein [Legionella sp. km772]
MNDKNQPVIEQEDMNQSLTIEMALNNISQYKGFFPKADVDYLLTKKEEVIPILLDSLDDALVNYPSIPNDNMHHVFALYLLAHFRCKAAFPKIIALLELPGEAAFHLLGDDMVTDYGMKNIIASTFNGDLFLLTKVIENQTLNEYVRASVLSSFNALCLLELIDKETLTKYLLELIDGKLEKDQPHLWAILAGMVMDLYLYELIPGLVEAFNKGYVDPDYTSLEDFEDWFANSDASTNTDKHFMGQYHYIDAIKDMEWWDCFQSDEDRRKNEIKVSNLMNQLLSLNSSERPIKSSTIPFQRAGIKTGRNDPCPCGSGLKYKKCCLH